MKAFICVGIIFRGFDLWILLLFIEEDSRKMSATIYI